MSLNVQVGTITQPGTTGNQTTSLPSGFDPKALILWVVPLASANGDGSVNTSIDAAICMGFATYRGGGAQGGYCTYYADDANTTAVNARGIDDTAILKLFSAGTTPTVDAQATFVSFGSGASSDFVLNWTNLHTTASIKICYMVLGGSDITDAYAFLFNLAAGATQDVTVTSGFGQPDLLFFMTDGALSGTGGDSASSPMPMFGVAKDDTERFCVVFNDEDAAGTMLLAGRAKARALLGVVPTTQAADFEADLSSKASWPTDGFQLSYSDQPANTNPIICLALKGSFTSKVGSMTATAGSTSDVDFDHGTTPKGALFFAVGGVGTGGTINTSSGQLGSINLGALDGTNTVCAGTGNDDGAASSNCFTSFSDVRAMTICEAAGWGAKATGAISGTNARLTWDGNIQSTVLHGVVTLGDSAGGSTITLDASLAGAGAITAGVDLTKTLDAALAGVGTIAAPVALTKALAASLSPVPTMLADFVRIKELAAAISTSPTLSAEFVRTLRTLNAAPAGVSAITAQQNPFRGLACALTPAPTISANFIRNQLVLAAALTPTPTIAAGLGVTKTLAASLAGTSTTTSEFVRIKLLQASLAGSSSLTADFVRAVGLAAALSTSPTVQANFVRAFIGLNAAISTNPAIQAALSNAAVPLAVSISGTSIITVDLARFIGIAAVLSVAANVSANVALTKTLAAVLSGTSSILADHVVLTGTLKDLSASIAGTSTVSAELVDATRALAAVIAVTATISANLSGGQTPPGAAAMGASMLGKFLPLLEPFFEPKERKAS